ncbi:MAG: hypothetical protein AB7F86_14225 [Bdellovibrionales bacterium]
MEYLETSAILYKDKGKDCSTSGGVTMTCNAVRNLLILLTIFIVPKVFASDFDQDEGFDVESEMRDDATASEIDDMASDFGFSPEELEAPKSKEASAEPKNDSAFDSDPAEKPESTKSAEHRFQPTPEPESFSPFGVPPTESASPSQDRQAKIDRALARAKAKAEARRAKMKKPNRKIASAKAKKKAKKKKSKIVGKKSKKSKSKKGRKIAARR